MSNVIGLRQCQLRTSTQRWLSSACERPGKYRFVGGKIVGVFCDACWREREEYFDPELELIDEEVRFK